VAQLVSLLGVPHDPTLPGAIARGGQEPIARAAELLARQRAELAAARPDAVLLVAGDHLNQWFLDNMPAFCVGKGERTRGPFADEVRLFGIEELDVPTEGGLARHLLTHGLEHGVDFSSSDEYTVDHAFTVPLLFVRPERDLPVVPLFTNVLAKPVPTARRFHDVGRIVRDAIDAWDGGRVAVVVTGHFTNNVGGPRMLDFLRQPQSGWDSRALGLIEAWDVETLIAESSYDALYRVGHATPAFLDFILAFGLAGRKPDWHELIASPAAPALPFFGWTYE
jgi:protocatechuate 4,5-dioxygenase beta chain